MFGLMLLTFVTLSHIYVLQRAGTVPWVQRRISRRSLLIAGVSLWVLFVLSRVYGHDRTGGLAWVLEVLGMHWMGSLLLCSVSFLLVDILSGSGCLLRRLTPVLRASRT